MIKNPSETKSDLTCEECGEPIKQNQTDNKPLYCEFCGALNSSVDSQHQEISQLEQERIRFSYTTEELSQEIRNLAYQKIYELLKANFSIMRCLKHQEGLKQSNILKLAKKLRRALLSLSLPSNSTELLTKTSKKKIENYFEDFQASLKKKKKNQSNYLPYLIKDIKFIYGLINGDYEFSALAKYNQKAVKKLKQKYGFKVNAKTKNSFSYSLTILLCRKIYKIITAQGHILDLKHNKNELTKQYTLNTAKDITALVLNNDFKRNFSKEYRRLKMDLEIDWVYRESFIEHVCSLIKLVYKLAYNNGYSSKLRGFPKLIAEDLKESAFFEDDTNFSPYLKLNLTLILSRVIHFILDSSQNLTPQQSDPRKLNHTDNLRLANEILDEILGKKKIKLEFLKKFYNLSLEEFQKNYEKLQVKLNSDMLYKENFLSFLQNLINTVYKITHIRSKKSNNLKIELAIIQDLANYNFNRESLKKEKSCFYLEEKEIIAQKQKDIFIVEIPENSPLWRLRAYFLGFFYTDGSIFRLKNPIQYMVYAAQNEKDKDIIENLQKAIGGNITGPNEVGRIRLEFTNKELYFKLKELGMVEKHNLKVGALKVRVPSIVNRKINGISLLRDFVRGLLDGDGCFSGCYEDYSLRYQLLGPKQFIKALNEKILEEIPDISSFITPTYLKVFLKDNKEHIFFGKNRIYIKGRGLYELTAKDLETGKIERREHKWLTKLHFAGAFNSIRFFKWLYCDDDNFDEIEISGIKLCGSRKFKKALFALGNKTKRKEKLAPEWRDIIYQVIPELDNKFYESRELMQIVNETLRETLNKLEIEHIFEGKKITKLDSFVYRLKFFEYIDKLIGHFRKKEGNVYKNYYYSKLNPPKNLPNNMFYYIDLVKLNGEIIRNIKNLIISLFIRNNIVKSFEIILEEILETKIFSKSSVPRSRIKLYLMELVGFNILLADDGMEDIKSNKFLFNLNALEDIFKLDSKVIKNKYYKFLSSLTKK